MSNFSSDRNALFAKSDAKAGKGAAPAVRLVFLIPLSFSNALPFLFPFLPSQLTPRTLCPRGYEARCFIPSYGRRVLSNKVA